MDVNQAGMFPMGPEVVWPDCPSRGKYSFYYTTRLPCPSANAVCKLLVADRQGDGSLVGHADRCAPARASARLARDASKDDLFGYGFFGGYYPGHDRKPRLLVRPGLVEVVVVVAGVGGH